MCVTKWFRCVYSKKVERERKKEERKRRLNKNNRFVFVQVFGPLHKPQSFLVDFKNCYTVNLMKDE